MLNQYFWNILIAIDQFINTICGGDPDETISSRLGKWHQEGISKKSFRLIIYKVINVIVELFQRDHFKKSIEEDEGSNKIIK
jgi:hypothetical protein